MSGTLCDLTVCCRDGTTASVAPSPTNIDEREAAPPAIQPVGSWNMPVANGGHLEMDEEISTMQVTSTTKQRRQRRASEASSRLV